MEWINVKDNTPNTYKVVLVSVKTNGKLYGCTNTGVEVMMGLLDDEGEWYRDDDTLISGYIGEVTHWFPLPEPPKEDY